MKAKLTIGHVVRKLTNHQGTTVTRVCYRVWANGKRENGLYMVRGMMVAGVKVVDRWFEWEGEMK